LAQAILAQGFLSCCGAPFSVGYPMESALASSLTRHQRRARTINRLHARTRWQFWEQEADNTNVESPQGQVSEVLRQVPRVEVHEATKYVAKLESVVSGRTDEAQQVRQVEELVEVPQVLSVEVAIQEPKSNKLHMTKQVPLPVIIEEPTVSFQEEVVDVVQQEPHMDQHLLTSLIEQQLGPYIELKARLDAIAGDMLIAHEEDATNKKMLDEANSKIADYVTKLDKAEHQLAIVTQQLEKEKIRYESTHGRPWEFRDLPEDQQLPSWMYPMPASPRDSSDDDCYSDDNTH